MRKALIKVIRLSAFIRKIIFPVNCCRFYPSCSEYTIQAVEKFGVFKALFISCKRILRCNPFSEGGYDPIKRG